MVRIFFNLDALKEREFQDDSVSVEVTQGLSLNMFLFVICSFNIQ